MKTKFNIKDFALVVLFTSIWVNAYQLIRFFGGVRDALQNYLSALPNVAPMNDVGVLLIWGAWDTLLSACYVYLFWLCMQVYGNNIKAIFACGLFSWALLYVLYWSGNANMNLIDWKTVGVILPLTLLETIISALLASKLYKWRESKSIILQQ